MHFQGNRFKIGVFKLTALLTLMVTAVGAGVLPMPVAHAASAQKIDANVNSALSVFKNKVKGSSSVLAKAKGLLVFPRVYQGGFFVGGEYGEGALRVNEKTVNYYNLVAGSYGFQLGVQRKAIIFAFMSEEALQKFEASSGWKAGVDASVAVVKLGAEGAIDTSTLNKPVLAFVIDQKGLMYDLSLEGAKITKINK